MINLGYCEIAFHQQNKIRLTPLAKKVLFENEKVQLNTIKKSVPKQVEQETNKTKTVKNSLFESLRKLRYEIAQEEEVPAYVIFSDSALRQMEINRPMSEEELITIDGVGKAKLEKYGDAFIKAIIAFHKDKKVKPKKGSNTYKETLALYQEGLTPEEIAEKRKLGVSTIISHLAKLYSDGASIDLKQFVSNEEVALISAAAIQLEKPTALKPYFDFFEEKMSYEKIRVGLAIIEKEENVM